MKLPFLDSIVIEESKLTNYILNANHPDGGVKAKFLIKRRFDKDSIKTALINQAKNEEVKEVKKSEFGIKYIIESKINSPDGKTFFLRSVWIVYLNEKFVKFITAYQIK
ncbi:MAG: hypothetical protein M3R36_04280 [Bacteroidota bacterium]|nr:hypothetical protein [Bacteroidota bacterium]